MEKEKKQVEVKNKTERYHSDEEIKNLAQDMVGNQVFCSDQMPNVNHLHLVFLPIALMDKKQRDKFIKDGVVHFYEYTKESLPRMINGMPIFGSVRALTYADYQELIRIEGKLRAAMKEALK